MKHNMEKWINARGYGWVYIRVQGMEAGSVSDRKYPLSHVHDVEPSRTE